MLRALSERHIPGKGGEERNCASLVSTHFENALKFHAVGLGAGKSIGSHKSVTGERAHFTTRNE
jgi:hypothetical protein